MMKYRYYFHRAADDVARTCAGWRGEGAFPNASPLVDTGLRSAVAHAERLADEVGESIVIKRQQGLGIAEPIRTVRPLV